MLENELSHTSTLHTLSRGQLRAECDVVSNACSLAFILIFGRICIQALTHILRIYPPSFQLRPAKHATPEFYDVARPILVFVKYGFEKKRLKRGKYLYMDSC
jgi:hypothetical protein